MCQMGLVAALQRVVDLLLAQANPACPEVEVVMNPILFPVLRRAGRELGIDPVVVFRTIILDADEPGIRAL